MRTFELKGNVRIGNVEIQFVVGDITKLDVDAIVNAANSYLQHGGGVAGAISRAGGPAIQEESDEFVRKNGPVPPGGVAVTGAGNLKAKYVIHTVGPIGNKEGNDEIMKKAFENVFSKADELNITSLAIPFVGTGIFGYPFENFIKICVDKTLNFFSNYSGPIKLVTFCDIDSSKVQKLMETFLKKSFSQDN
ncbi:O-acetyl-ADP-ribose deacetylase (regulator of RNase III), contains Macro domain [Fervidobacterium changbaicum]|uniref:Macro domain-containing protein n=2 Tax=Fervidobacterium TaxID=2422 RepID=A0AAI8CNP4_FERIS|nr:MULTISPECIES: macro domain-containing protein [Fervidobacterium]AMW33663.2 macro domain-containing protein [Fervidobacterium islandicum]QAV32431.1 macro domain-containing protein [Fervidobacterium changbaicum]SDH19319.1 O-acetyl-ADP-ribose deacetylase (regulator of RNase III), contains Macro domain [Fervidobacterium changbaicum]